MRNLGFTKKKHLFLAKTLTGNPERLILDAVLADKTISDVYFQIPANDVYIGDSALTNVNKANYPVIAQMNWAQFADISELYVTGTGAEILKITCTYYEEV